MPLKVTINDRSWLTEDLTLDELADVEHDAGESWSFVLQAPLKTAVSARAILVRFLAREHGPEQAVKLAGGMTFREVLDAFEFVEDDRPEEYKKDVPVVDPKAGTDEPGTTSSPSSPASPTGGPPT